jgi:rhodanese-related sulfurtransferase
MREFKAVELKAYLESCEHRPLLLDVRQPWEYDVCNLEGSELIPMSQIQARVGELDPAKETVVICHHGIRSRAVARFLDQSGFSNVINLDGGVEQWAKTVDNTMATY